MVSMSLRVAGVTFTPDETKVAQVCTSYVWSPLDGIASPLLCRERRLAN
jgi:hypothetical protein